MENFRDKKFILKLPDLFYEISYHFSFFQDLLTADFEIGHYIRDRIIPRAVLFFTGKLKDNIVFIITNSELSLIWKKKPAQDRASSKSILKETKPLVNIIIIKLVKIKIKLLTLKLIFSKKAKKIDHIHHRLDTYNIASNQRWRFHQFLWPS